MCNAQHTVAPTPEDEQTKESLALLPCFSEMSRLRTIRSGRGPKALAVPWELAPELLFFTVEWRPETVPVR